jgi:ankyrin repeat protein
MNTFQKKPYNPNIKKIYPTIVAPTFEDDNNKLAQLFILIEQGNIAEVKKYILTTRVKLSAIYNDDGVLHKVLMIDDTKMPESKKLDFIIFLVSNGALINSYNKYNITPLHLAVQKKYLSIVKYFVQKNANINAVTNENLTPLHYATLINIDSCPSDYAPQNIIDINEKKIDYNEISNILLEAFKENKEDVEIYTLPAPANILKYNQDGTIDDNASGPIVRQPVNPVNPVTTKLLDSITTKKNIQLVKYLIDLMPDIETIKQNYFTNIKIKIQDNKTIISNMDGTDIGPSIKEEIRKLKKKIVIKKDIESIINDNNTVELSDIVGTYYDSLQKLIEFIDKFINELLYKQFFKYVVELFLKDPYNAAFNTNPTDPANQKPGPEYSKVYLTPVEINNLLGSIFADFYKDANVVGTFAGPAGGAGAGGVAGFYFNIKGEGTDNVGNAFNAPNNGGGINAPNASVNQNIEFNNTNVTTPVASTARDVNATNQINGVNANRKKHDIIIKKRAGANAVLGNVYTSSKYYGEIEFDNVNKSHVNRLGPGGGGPNIYELVHIIPGCTNYFYFYLLFIKYFEYYKTNPDKSPKKLHEILYFLSIINKHVYEKLENYPDIEKIITKIKNNTEKIIREHSSMVEYSIQKLSINTLIQQLNAGGVPTTNNLDQVLLIYSNPPVAGQVEPRVRKSNILINFELNFDIYKKIGDKYEDITITNQNNDPNKLNFLKQFINISYIEYMIANFLKQVRTTYYFNIGIGNGNGNVNENYYDRAFKILEKLEIPDNKKHELVRDFIYKLYDKIIIDYINNFINETIREKFKEQIAIKIPIIPAPNYNIIDIYLPHKEYTFNSYKYTNDIINSIINIKDTTDINEKKRQINLKLNEIKINKIEEDDFKLIEDEDYDIYDDKNFNADIITLNNINKYYPIFYSYNYDGQEINKECVLINYELIHFLLKAGANINIKDQTGKTVIDYIIDAKMHYIFNDNTEYIKNRLVNKNLQYILEKMIKNETEHNNLFGYNNNSIKLLENYEYTLIEKLKNTDEIKNNIPLNIKYIFKTFLLLQNIYWYRMLNKEFFLDEKYLEFFNIQYKIKINVLNKKITDLDQFKLDKSSFDINLSNKLDKKSDWKNIISDISGFTAKTNFDKIIENKKNKLNKSTTLIEKNVEGKNIFNTYELNETKNKLLLELQEKQNQDNNNNIYTNKNKINVQYFENENITSDKSITFFRMIFKENNSIYNYIWELINNFDKPYFIHLKMCEIYNKILEKPINNNIKKQSYSAISLIKQQQNINILDKEKIDNLNENIILLIKYMKPISKFIDGRMYEPVLSTNSLLLFQIRTTIHILTAFIGSNMYLFIKRLLSYYYKKTTDKNINIEQKMEKVKDYILSDLLIDGKLSYDFVKLIKPFKIREYDFPKENNMDDIFEKIILKLNLDDIKDDDLIINIRTKLLPYYQSLYKEVTIQLFNFSDSYYRFIKNQYAGLLMINKCC